MKYSVKFERGFSSNGRERAGMKPDTHRALVYEGNVVVYAAEGWAKSVVRDAAKKFVKDNS